MLKLSFIDHASIIHESTAYILFSYTPGEWMNVCNNWFYKLVQLLGLPEVIYQSWMKSNASSATKRKTRADAVEPLLCSLASAVTLKLTGGCSVKRVCVTV